MTVDRSIEHELTMWLGADRPVRAPDGLHDAAMRRVAGARPRSELGATLHAALAERRTTPMRPASRMLLVAATIILTAALLAGAIAAGFLRLPSRPATWSAVAPMTVERSRGVSALLHDGRVLETGGRSLAAELFDPTTGTWAVVAPPSELGHDGSVVLDDGRVLVIGSRVASGPIQASGGPGAEIFDPATRRWTPTPPMQTVRSGSTATRLPDGSVLVAGGYAGTRAGDAAVAERFDPSSGTWSDAGRLAHPRERHISAALPDGRVLIAGGVGESPDGTGQVLDSVELFDPRTGTWDPGPSMLEPRSWGQAVGLRDGRVLVMGGSDVDGVAVRTGELFDPATGRWSQTGPLASPGSFGSLVALDDGDAIAIGGTDATGISSAVERFDAATGQWRAMTPMPGPREMATATVLLDGRVLVAGGHDGQTELDSAVILDPGSGD